MVFGRTPVVPYVAALVFVVLFFGDAEYHVKGHVIFLANVGENLTLNCSTDRSSGPIGWLIGNREWITVVRPNSSSGEVYAQDNRNRFSSLYEVSSRQRSFTLFIYNVNVTDSENYTCLVGEHSEKQYDVRVMECTNCLVDLPSGLDSLNRIIICSLFNFHGSQTSQMNITLNKTMTKRKSVTIYNEVLKFNIAKKKLKKGFTAEFNPYPERENIGFNIICIVPPQLRMPDTKSSTLSPSSSQPKTTTAEYGTSATSSPMSLDIFISRATVPATSIKNLKSTDPIALLQNISSITSISTTSNQLLENTHSDIDSSNYIKNSAMVLIIAFSCSIVILILIVIILVLRFKQKLGRKENEPNPSETNGSVSDRAPTDGQDTQFESPEETSGVRSGELIDNVLYESSDGINGRSISRSTDQLDTALYTIPDKTGIINRVAQSKAVSVSDSSTTVNLHGNNGVIIQEQDEKYENVDMLNLARLEDGDNGTKIPLYAMPGKGPRSTRNTTETGPETASPRDGPDIPIYAMPDEVPLSSGNNVKSIPAPGARKNGGEIPLYAVSDKGPRSITSTKDEKHDEALYAEVDKPKGI